jgi:hypothetical protein
MAPLLAALKRYPFVGARSLLSVLYFDFYFDFAQDKADFSTRLISVQGLVQYDALRSAVYFDIAQYIA